MVAAQTYTSQGQTRAGGRSSSIKENTSSTSKTIRQLMSMEEKMKKEEMLLFGTSMEELTRDGRSSI
jgi:hypothetical protein